MPYYFSLFVVILIPFLYSCNESESRKATNPLVSDIDTSFYLDSLPSKNDVINYSNEPMDTLKLDFYDFEMQFPGLSVYTDGNALLLKDTTELFIELTSKIDTFSISLKNKKIKSCKISEQYENVLSVSDEGPHIELYEWKTYLSEWIDTDSISTGLFLMKNISEEESSKFPKFTREELVKYLELNAGENWANLIRKPEAGKWTDPFWIGVGIRRLLIKITLMDDTEIHKLLVIYPAMGC